MWGERADTWERDEPIADRMERLAQTAIVRGGEIAATEPKALGVPDQALIDSGLAMADFGNSMPGGGAEHHISHCWEMRALIHGRARQLSGGALLHGAKVGVGTVMAAGWYAAIREMTQREAANRLAGGAVARTPELEIGGHRAGVRPGGGRHHCGAAAVPAGHRRTSSST